MSVGFLWVVYKICMEMSVGFSRILCRNDGCVCSRLMYALCMICVGFMSDYCRICVGFFAGFLQDSYMIHV